MRIQAYMDLLYVTKNLRDMALWMFSDLVVIAAGVSAILLLAARFGGIGAWRQPQIVFMLGYGVVVMALIEFFFGYNVGFISRRIGRGQLDHTLIQPLPIWMAFATEGFVPFSAFVFLSPGLGLMAWSASRLPLTMDARWFALLGGDLAASVAAVVSFSFIWGSMAFWSPAGAEEISTNAMGLVDQLKPFPLDGMGRGIKVGLMGLAPAGFVAWYPCRYLTGMAPMGWGAAVTFGAAALLAATATAVFSIGMKQYAQTGSRRYLSLGHRR